MLFIWSHIWNSRFVCLSCRQQVDQISLIKRNVLEAVFFKLAPEPGIIYVFERLEMGRMHREKFYQSEYD